MLVSTASKVKPKCFFTTFVESKQTLNTMPLVNERVFTILEDGTTLSYAKGYKDMWCVYSYVGDNTPVAPRDQDYFNELLALADKHGHEYVYEDFVRIYDRTNENPEPEMVGFIKSLVRERYTDEEYMAVVKLFIIYYMAMVAEYYYVNRFGQPSRLTKRTKRLGVYQFLFGGLTVLEAKEFSKGKRFSELDALCNKYGF